MTWQIITVSVVMFAALATIIMWITSNLTTIPEDNWDDDASAKDTELIAYEAERVSDEEVSEYIETILRQRKVLSEGMVGAAKVAVRFNTVNPHVELALRHREGVANRVALQRARAIAECNGDGSYIPAPIVPVWMPAETQVIIDHSRNAPYDTNNTETTLGNAEAHDPQAQ